MGIRIEPFDAALGARIRGMNPVAERLGGADRARLREALLEHGLLLAKGLERISPEQHVALSRVFGECAIHPSPMIRLKGQPEVIVLEQDPSEAPSGDDPSRDDVVGQIAWHSDLTYTDTPSRGALLLARAVPPELGHTGFIDTAAVYDALPEALRERIDGLRAIHGVPLESSVRSAVRSTRDTEDGEAPAFPPVTHPLVHEHPESGRKALNISPLFLQSIEGLREEDSRALIDQLVAFATQDRFVYLHRWEVGDLLIWDNWRTMHRATGCKRKHLRRMHRTTLAPRAGAQL